jgi:MFS family permease
MAEAIALDLNRVAARPATGGWYRWYVLFVLMLVYAFNYIDRQIVTILAPYLKADLAITDAQLGLLFGTAFALFYGLFGIPLARLADGWSRVKTLALGLSFWSGMTALSGFAGNFAQLGGARIGVGVGEASATPAAVSLLGDYFDRRIRGTVLALYSVGIYIGAGVSLMIGGSIVIAWGKAFGDPATAPLGLAGWQVAFIAVGMPGLLLAAIVWLTIREPQRGRLEGRVAANDPAPFSTALREMACMFPPWSVARLARPGVARGELHRNLAWLALTILAVILATTASNAILTEARRPILAAPFGFAITTNHVQWIAMGIAAYASASWFQSVRLRDPGAARMITASATFRAVILAGAALAFSMNAVNGFVFVHAQRYLGLGAEIGVSFGAIALVAGASGIIVSGFLSDQAKRWHPSGRLYFAAITTMLFTIASLIEFTTSDVRIFFIAYAVATFFVPMWFGPLQATTQDLVTPRLRGTAFAVFSLGPNIIGLGLGPYSVGLISDASGSLRLGILAAICIVPVSLGALLFAARRLPAAEAQVLAQGDAS